MTGLSEEWIKLIGKINRLLNLIELKDNERLEYFLYYLLLKKELSGQNLNSSVPGTISWRDILTATIDHSEDAGKKLDLAFSLLVEQKFKRVTEDFISPKFDSLPPDQTNKIINALSSLPADDNNLIGEIADFIIHESPSFTKKGGSISTPKYISQLIASLVVSSPDLNICDLNCSDGTTLIECASRSTNIVNHQALIFSGISQNKQDLTVCLLNLALHDIPLPNIYTWKKNGKLTDYKEELKTCNRIIGLYPPFFAAPVLRKHQKDSIIDVVNLLSPGGMGAIIVPARMLGGELDASARTTCVNNDTLEAIIRLPTPMFLGSGVGTYLITVKPEKTQPAKNKILFIDIAGFLENKKNTNLDTSDLEEIFKKYQHFAHGSPDQDGGLLDNFTCVVSTEIIKKSNYILTIHRYVQPPVDRIDIESCFWDLQETEKKRQNLENSLDIHLKKIIEKLKKRN